MYTIYVGKEELPSVTSRLVTGPAWTRPAVRERSKIGLENFMVVGMYWKVLFAQNNGQLTVGGNPSWREVSRTIYIAWSKTFISIGFIGVESSMNMIPYSLNFL